MDRASYLSSIRADADLLVAAAGTDLDRPVPTCPGWTCERLLSHVGRVHRWTAGWVARGEGVEVEKVPTGAAVIGWFRAGVDELVGALEAAGPDATVDTWAGSQPAIFWPRRMALETVLHRYDAQVAAGTPTPIPTPLAVAGIDEMFAVILPWRDTSALAGAGETIHLHATDDDLDRLGGGEWLATLGESGVSVERVHAKGDLAVRGPASDLLLLWNRSDADHLEVFGDTSLLARWRAAVTV